MVNAEPSRFPTWCACALLVAIGILGCESEPTPPAAPSVTSAAPDVSAVKVDLVEARAICDALCDKIASCTEAERALADEPKPDFESAPPEKKAELLAKEIDRQAGQVANKLLEACRTNCKNDPASDDEDYKKLLACSKKDCDAFMECAGGGPLGGAP